MERAREYTDGYSGATVIGLPLPVQASRSISETLA